jgi:hypothetical protein
MNDYACSTEAWRCSFSHRLIFSAGSERSEDDPRFLACRVPGGDVNDDVTLSVISQLYGSSRSGACRSELAMQSGKRDLSA